MCFVSQKVEKCYTSFRLFVLEIIYLSELLAKLTTTHSQKGDVKIVRMTCTLYLRSRVRHPSTLNIACSVVFHDHAPYLHDN